MPTWDELVPLIVRCHEGSVPLHLDGARLWESQSFYDRPLAEAPKLLELVGPPLTPWPWLP